ncbi:hypothetical protein BDR26DRAFT_849341 [Obelidium mucronatum]|nr:hypothetical protein BDR26DRAFT_849341 [Obelidium mucronatum]
MTGLVQGHVEQRGPHSITIPSGTAALGFFLANAGNHYQGGRTQQKAANYVQPLLPKGTVQKDPPSLYMENSRSWILFLAGFTGGSPLGAILLLSASVDTFLLLGIPLCIYLLLDWSAAGFNLILIPVSELHKVLRLGFIMGLFTSIALFSILN